MRLLSLLCLLAFSTGLLAADDKKAGEAKATANVRVTGLIVHKSPPRKQGAMMFSPTGTTLELLLSQAGTYFIGIDAKASKLDSFTDDKKNNLYKKTGALFGGQPNWINSFASMSAAEEGEYSIQITAANAPGKGATKILAKGTLVAKCGADEKTLEKKELALKPNEEVSVGDFKVKVNFAGGFGANLTVTSSEPRLKTMEFFDAAGKAIKIASSHRFTFPSGPGGKPQTQVNYFLNGNLKGKIAFKLTHFGKFESVKVPFDVRVGLDLE